MQTHLNRNKTINLGSFYTPKFIVDIAYKLLWKYADLRQYLLFDNACGYGDFFTENLHYLGADIDIFALKECSKRIGESNNTNATLIHTNSLLNVSREKFNIPQDKNLIIIGNPPYNDRTSLIRNSIKNREYAVDSNLLYRDLGISFLRSLTLLKPEFICILHPLSYLIKPTNFKALKDFTQYYRLIDGLIVSSSHFSNAKTAFPILIALYGYGSMNYDFIKYFKFHTFEGQTLQLSKFDFISNYITKYPNPRDTREAVAYFYPLRDINALKRNQTFKKTLDTNTIKIFKENLGYYHYIHHFKQFAQKLPYYFGNLEPFIDHETFLTIQNSFMQLDYQDSKIQNYFKNLLAKVISPHNILEFMLQ